MAAPWNSLVNSKKIFSSLTSLDGDIIVIHTYPEGHSTNNSGVMMVSDEAN